jgi:BirA family biotin operon repressor/biotin-[acetyl-CoA-carboxylase] ligase
MKDEKRIQTLEKVTGSLAMTSSSSFILHPSSFREEWSLPTRRLGRRVLVYDRVDSTNTLAAALADDPANDGIIILADEQSAGRGQHGRVWHTPARTAVLMSVLCLPPPALRRPAVLTAWAAVAVCETVRLATGAQAKIKWPNDVLIRGHKVCGILAEQARGTVIGIGLNVNQTAEHFLAAGLPQATSLAVVAGRSLPPYDVARLLISQLDEEYNRLYESDRTTLEACWKWRLGLLGKFVTAECHDGTWRGRLVEMGFDGLQLQTPSGEKIRLVPETVRHLFSDGS